jgi:hypothetical protein
MTDFEHVPHHDTSEESPLDTRDEPRTEITSAQAAARRDNGTKSKGPVTAEGKATSSANAMRHGLYATKIPVITRGPLREDPDEVFAFRRGVVDALDPHDDLQVVLAGRVASLAWRLVRAEKLEASVLAHPDWDRAHEKRAEVQAHRGRVLLAAMFLRGYEDGAEREPNFVRNAVVQLRDFDTVSIEPEQVIVPARPTWPTTRQAWLDLVNRGLPDDDHYPTLDDVAESLEMKADWLEERAIELEDRARERAARLILDDGLLDRLATLEGRHNRQLNDTLARLKNLQAEAPNGRARNEPTEASSTSTLSNPREAPNLRARNEPTARSSRSTPVVALDPVERPLSP